MKKNLLVLVLVIVIGSVSAQNNSLAFDGSDDYVNCGNSSSFEIAAGTIEVWFKVDQLGQRHTLVGKRLFGGYYNGLLLRTYEGTNKIWFYLESTSAYAAINSDNAIAADTWYHVAIKWGSSGMKMYVNGVLQSETNAATYPMIAAGGNFIMGSNYNGTSLEYIEHLNGNLDEVRIWNDVRTEDEIRQNMYRELPNPSGETNLVAYYKLNETSGTSAEDSKGSNDGTLTNMAGNEWQTSPAMFGPKNCLDFDGYNDWISTSVTMPTVYTKEAWVYIPSANGNNKNVVSGGDVDGTHALWVPGNTNKLSAGHGLPYDAVKDPNVFPFGSWQHVAVTYASGTMTLYRNGVQVDQATGIAAFTGTTVRIGA
jgi:hypothetical protein